MDENTPDVRVLQGLYQRYLQQAVDLAQENVSLQIRIADLEAALQPADTDA